MKEQKRGFLHNLGDMIERVGEIIIKRGATKLGRKIYDTGDKIEHMNEKPSRKTV